MLTLKKAFCFAELSTALGSHFYLPLFVIATKSNQKDLAKTMLQRTGSARLAVLACHAY
jgi:hypothetical protein